MSSRRRFLKYLATAAGALTVVGCYPIFIERYTVQVNRYRLRIPRLPPAFNGFTIVHLTDLHYGMLQPYAFLGKVVRTANAIPRDLTVCTGDYVHERPSTEQVDRMWGLLPRLNAACGVCSTLGNHDHWADTDRSIYWLERSGQSVRHTARCITREGQRLWVAGAGDLWEDHLALDKVLASVPEEECRIVLAHNPDTADSDFRVRVDLMLCGHTHGGQVRLPGIGTPVLPVRNKRYSSGVLRADKGFPLFISRGIGWAVYPVRFNCVPEIAVLELAAGPAREALRPGADY